ncbi:MAG: hypothetical protein VX834_01100, partial [Myxococcota bacterium]|nr:hypothetical protein [Myxococcota bacterium]
SSLSLFILYWTYNPIYAKENFKKQSMHFGKDKTNQAQVHATKVGEKPTAPEEQMMWKMPAI